MTFAVEGENATMAVHNRSTAQTYQIKNRQAFGRDAAKIPDMTAVAVRDGEKIVSRTKISPKGWWSFRYLWSDLPPTDSETPRAELAPGMSLERQFNWHRMLMGLSSNADMYDDDLKETYSYRLRTVVSFEDNEVICESRWLAF